MTVRLKTLPDALRGGAWPSSARAVRCPVKSGNERNPCPLLPGAGRPARHSEGTAGVSRRKERATVGDMPRMPRATRALQWPGQWEATPKGGANPLNLVSVGIAGWNSPA